MKLPSRHAVLLPIGWMVLISRVAAHPGHDDGHELTWDLGHLAAHPLATFGCVVLLTGVIGTGWYLLRRRSRVQPAANAS
jgi:hypothetical protein